MLGAGQIRKAPARGPRSPVSWGRGQRAATQGNGQVTSYLPREAPEPMGLWPGAGFSERKFQRAQWERKAPWGRGPPHFRVTLSKFPALSELQTPHLPNGARPHQKRPDLARVGGWATGDSMLRGPRARVVGHPGHATMLSRPRAPGAKAGPVPPPQEGCTRPLASPRCPGELGDALVVPGLP